MGAGKRRGTVHPSNPLSPPPTRPSSSSSCRSPESVLELLPVTILALAFSLPTQDREVLAYLLARSIPNPSSSSTSSSSSSAHQTNKCKKRTSVAGDGGPLFGCGCFECYTSFWFRWDSSPNRELIDQVIEAFEEHLVANETNTKTKTKAKKKTKNDVNPSSNTGKKAGVCNFEEEVVLVPDKVYVEVELEESGGGGDDVAAEIGGGGGGRSNHKCLARKVLPDVVGLFNSRFWSFWSSGI